MADSFVLQKGMHVHLVGIGGTGLSAIAQVLLGRGFGVSGSDMQRNAMTATLEATGAVVYEGHRAEQIRGADALLISSAIPADNPEVAAATAAGIPVLKRSDVLGQLMAEMVGVAVAGTHGKTTTTAMIGHILLHAGKDPTVILGGVLPEWQSNGRAGSSDLFVVEADEYDYMFLGLHPKLAVITNIEHDHPDIFPSEAVYMQAFRDFVGQLAAEGQLVVSGEDDGVQRLLDTLAPSDFEIVTYGLALGAGAPAELDYRASEWRANQLGGTDFVLEAGEQVLGLVRLRVPGLHNVRNALAAIVVAMQLEVSFGTICQALAEFGGVGRRFQVTGEVGDVTIIDDYAHHPTEVRATLAAARQRYPGRRLWAVWQPHTYSRTKMLLSQFGASFDEADRLIVLDVYRSRENDTLGLSGAGIVAAMNHPHVVHMAEKEEAATYLLDRVRPDDVILTLGAGDGNLVGEAVLEALRLRVAPR